MCPVCQKVRQNKDTNVSVQHKRFCGVVRKEAGLEEAEGCMMAREQVESTHAWGLGGLVLQRGKDICKGRWDGGG